MLTLKRCNSQYGCYFQNCLILTSCLYVFDIFVHFATYFTVCIWCWYWLLLSIYQFPQLWALLKLYSLWLTNYCLFIYQDQLSCEIPLLFTWYKTLIWYWINMYQYLGNLQLIEAEWRMICVSKLAIIGSDNGLLPGLHQAIIWTSARILLIRPLGTNFSEGLNEIQTFSLKKICFKVCSAKCCPFCVDLNVLRNLKCKVGVVVQQLITKNALLHVQSHIVHVSLNVNTFPTCALSSATISILYILWNHILW